jgi:ABC-type transporter Mla subunit MlaD
MSRNIKIDQILEQRQPLADRLKKVIQQLDSKGNQLEGLQNSTRKLIEQISNQGLNTANSLEIFAGKISELKGKIEAEKPRIEQLRYRLSRPTLNIGVAGTARQGKSTLLQKLTRLTDLEIPSSDGLVCTAVRSTIYHRPGKQTSGEITFYTVQSFLDEVIAPYFIELGLGTPPSSLDEFDRMSLTLPTALKRDTTGEQMFEYLKKNYKDQLNQYRDLLGQPPLPITQTQIPDYVAKNIEGRPTSYKHLAVKEAKIYCEFGLDDIGKIALIDMPGLGENKLGNEKTLLTILGRDADIVIIIRMPNPLADDWFQNDTNLYRIANEASLDLELKKWAFLVLNCNGKNERVVDLLSNNIPSGMKFVQTIKATCANETEANERILVPILDYLVANITNLDRQYASACQDRVKDLAKEINRVLEQGTVLLNQEYELNQNFKFENLFKTFLSDMGNGLNEVLQKTTSNDLNSLIKDAIKETIEDCRNNVSIPSSDEITDLYVSPNYGQRIYKATYLKLLTELRVSLSKEFLLLNSKLRSIVQSQKIELVEVLREKGKLKNLTEVRDIEFLNFMKDFLQESRSKLLLSGFDFLSEFELSYQAELLRIIRGTLEKEVDADTLKNDDLSTSVNAQAVQNKLAQKKTLVERALESDLNAWSGKIAKDIDYMVSQFIDMLLYFRDADTAWRIVLNQNDVRSKIWEELRGLEELQISIRKWKAEVEKAKTGLSSINELGSDWES